MSFQVRNFGCACAKQRTARVRPGTRFPTRASPFDSSPFDKRQGHGRQGNSNVVCEIPRRQAWREEGNKAGETRLLLIQLNCSAFYNSNFTVNEGVFPIDNL